MHLMVKELRHAPSVLLLETSGRSRDMHAMILMTHGHDIECTANAARAWRIWKTKRPDLVLVALDIHDRRLFEVVERIRRSDMSQLVGVLRPALCSLSVDGRTIRRAMPPDDALVAAGATCRPRSRIVTRRGTAI
jgi:CheY-like chemotaxis protein